MAQIDVKGTLPTAAVDVAVGRKARLQRRSPEGPKSVGKLSFHYEREKWT
jgi:hypothetical protein